GNAREGPVRVRVLHAPGLDTTPIDVVPQADPELKPARVGLVNHPVEGAEIRTLVFRSEVDDPDLREPIDIEEVRISRGEVTPVLVAKDQHERIEGVARQHVEVPVPVSLIEESALEAGPVHGVDGEGPVADVWSLGRVPDLAERVKGGRGPPDPIRKVEQ